MTKKVGIGLIVIFGIAMMLLVFYQDALTKGQLFSLVLLNGGLFSLGGALVPMNFDNAKRNKIKKIYFIAALTLTGAGFVLKHHSLLGGGVGLVTGVLWYCFAYAPLEVKYKYLKWKPFSKSRLEIISLSFIDFFGLTLVSLGLLLTVLKWPHSIKFLILGVLILAVGLVFWNFKFKKQVVQRKKSEDLLKSQHKEITDSINYARRIQSAILPNKSFLKTHLKESFVLYKPKDIVAGDFYWMKVVDNKVLFAVADCTGHGVPGALVSVVCNNALNRSTSEFGLTEPGVILDKTRDLVIGEFEQSDEQVSDGMDIAFCCLEGNSLKYAGANNPLWVINENGVTEIKSDKQPIGKYPKNMPFTTHTLELQKGDTIYLFSDGFPDQFGGENEKKYKRKKMKDFLISVRAHSMKEQHELLNQEFESWKGKFEQLDDVCIMGVRI